MQSRRSLQLADAYRRGLLAIGARVEAQAREHWPLIGDLDETKWPERMAIVVERAQVQGIRLTGGYLAAVARAETGRRGDALALDTTAYAGTSRDGRPLGAAFASPIVAVLSALKVGRSPADALEFGLVKGVRYTSFEAVQTARDALTDAIEADDRFTEPQRSVAGTCAACMALSGTDNTETHPGCQCVFVPKVRGAREVFAIPTGVELFKALTAEQQDKAIGAEAAQLVRDDEADLKDFVSHSKQSEQDDFITQKPVQDVTA